jgi:hypothetical protein
VAAWLKTHTKKKKVPNGQRRKPHPARYP